MPIRSLLTLCAVCGLASSLPAQSLPLAHIGARVRLSFERVPPVVGMLSRLSPDSVTIEGQKPRDQRVLLRSSISRVEVSLRQESQMAKGVGRGVVGGVLLGGVAALVASMVTPDCNDAGDFEYCHKISAGALLGIAGLGAVTGAVLGSQWAAKNPRDVWAEARWSDAAGPARPTSKPMPFVGFGRADSHRILMLGVSLVR